MSSPRIVVAMGCYNEAQHLGETIPAVLNQTMPDFRLFVLDNGSTDKSWAILKGFAAYDDRITLLRSQRNLQCPRAMNMGMHVVTELWPQCQWFLNAGADDLMAPGYLEAILATAEAHPTVNLIFSPVTFIDHPEKETYTYPPFDATRVHEKLFVPGWRAFTRELWDALGGEWTGIDQGSDWEWICRASSLGLLRPRQLSKPYLALRIRDGRERVSQSHLGDWSTLHARMCELMGKPMPEWAARERKRVSA